MHINPDDFEQARLARDPRFDGRVFIGVLTTGIYCRPVCPVRMPRRENIRLYATAAAAAEAGFRPCLRCRPESSPGTPAWVGSSHTVSRALQLIQQGAVAEEGISALAAQLDIGPRHLSRLFQQHLGVSPLAVANTQRLHLAKKLIDETRLPMTAVCHAAGFSSVRRFNAVFQEVYGRSPLSLRAREAQGPESAESGITLQLHYRPPFDWRAMLAYLAYRAIPGVEVVGETHYSRSFLFEEVAGEWELSFLPSRHAAQLRVRHPAVKALPWVLERVRRMFDLRGVSAEIDAFFARDSRLAPLVARFPGIRVPVAWDGCEVAVPAILGQQVSVKGATTLVSRLAQACGTPYTGSGHPALTRVFPTPAQLADASLDGLGITTRRCDAIRLMAREVRDGHLRFDGSQRTEAFVDQITRIPGIGPWTAHYIALRDLNDPDAFPQGDLILQRAAAGEGDPLSARELLEVSTAWRPWRAYAVMLLWHAYATQKAADAAPRSEGVPA